MVVTGAVRMRFGSLIIQISRAGIRSASLRYVNAIGSHFLECVEENRMSAACREYPHEGTELEYACYSSRRWLDSEELSEDEDLWAENEGVLERWGGTWGMGRPPEALQGADGAEQEQQQGQDPSAPGGVPTASARASCATRLSHITIPSRRHAAPRNDLGSGPSPALGALTIHRLHGI